MDLATTELATANLLIILIVIIGGFFFLRIIKRKLEE